MVKLERTTLPLSAQDGSLFFYQTRPGQRPSELLSEWVEVCLSDLRAMPPDVPTFCPSRGRVKFVFFLEPGLLKRIRKERKTTDVAGFLLWCIGEMNTYFSTPTEEETSDDPTC